MKDDAIGAPKRDAKIAGLDNGSRAAIVSLVRLLARQAAKQDYERAIEKARAITYATERARGRTAEEN